MTEILDLITWPAAHGDINVHCSPSPGADE